MGEDLCLMENFHGLLTSAAWRLKVRGLRDGDSGKERDLRERRGRDLQRVTKPVSS